jgi:hypothetical protein
MTAYPLVMVPTFAVPLALMLHGLVLLRLRRAPQSAGWLRLDASRVINVSEGGQVAALLSSNSAMGLGRVKTREHFFEVEY